MTEHKHKILVSELFIEVSSEIKRIYAEYLD
jgi:hypothetical protein